MANKAILKKTETKFMARIPQAEITKTFTDLTSGARDLLMYYYSRNDGWVFEDGNIAKTLGTSERQLKRYRKELLDKEYLLIHKGETDVYFIGQGAVKKFKESYNQESYDEEPADPLVSRGTKI